MSDQDFPELQELRQWQRNRHRKVIAGLIGGGAAGIVIGLTIFALAGGESPALGAGAVAVVCIGVGAVMVVRGIISAVTDIDTKPRKDLEPLTLAALDDEPMAADAADAAGHDDANDAPDKGSDA